MERTQIMVQLCSTTKTSIEKRGNVFVKRALSTLNEGITVHDINAIANFIVLSSLHGHIARKARGNGYNHECC